MGEDLLTNVRAWIEGEGYPLEMYGEKVLTANGFMVIQSERYVDAKETREIDLVASKHETFDPNLPTRYTLVIECKSAAKGGQPWVLFTSPRMLINANELLRNLIVTPPAKNAIVKLSAMATDVIESELLRSGPRLGFALSTAFRDKNALDLGYNACRSAIRAATSLAQNIRPPELHGRLREFFFPVVLFGGRLFEAYLDEANDLQVLEVQQGVVVWREGSFSGNAFSSVRIVTKSYFEEFAKGASGSIRSIAKIFSHSPMLLDT